MWRRYLRGIASWLYSLLRSPPASDRSAGEEFQIQKAAFAREVSGTANKQTRAALTNMSPPRWVRIIASRVARLPGRSVRELPCEYGETRHRREKGGTPSSLPWRATEFQRQDRAGTTFFLISPAFCASRTACSSVASHRLSDSAIKVAHFAGPVVEFEGCGSEKAAAGENFLFRVAEPVSTESSQARESVCLKSRPNDCLHENTTGLLHHSALKVFFRTEVSEKAALTYLQGRREFADGEPFETFERSNIYGSLQNRAASLNAARTPALIRCRDAGWRSGCQRLPRTAQRMVA